MARVIIQPPASEAGIQQFIGSVQQHREFEEVEYRTVGLLHEVLSRGGTSITQWSQLRHGWHHQVQSDRVALHAKIRGELLLEEARAAKGAAPIVVVIMGPPGSGKTTVGVPFARQRKNVQFSGINPADPEIIEEQGW